MLFTILLCYVMIIIKKGASLMTKKRFTTYLEEKELDKLKKLSEETRVPTAKYIQEAIEDLLKKYGKD